MAEKTEENNYRIYTTTRTESGIEHNISLREEGTPLNEDTRQKLIVEAVRLTKKEKREIEVWEEGSEIKYR